MRKQKHRMRHLSGKQNDQVTAKYELPPRKVRASSPPPPCKGQKRASDEDAKLKSVSGRYFRLLKVVQDEALALIAVGVLARGYCHEE